MNRYQELKKENNQIISFLGDQYQILAIKLAKRVRKFAVKSEDSEIKLKDDLIELKEKEDKGININSIIPNHDQYISDKLKNYSKKYVDKDYIKGIIILSIIIIIAVGWFIFSKILSKTPTLSSPDSFIVTMYGSDAQLSWREVDFADGYKIYYIYQEDGEEKKSSEYTTTDDNIKITINKKGTITFYVIAYSDNNINPSNPSQYTIEIE